MVKLGIACAFVLLLRAPEALDRGCQVTLYDEELLDGTPGLNVTLTLGEYTREDLLNLGFGDNKVSSLSVIGVRCVATMYERDYLDIAGWYIDFPQGNYMLQLFQTRGATDNQVTSVRVWRTSCSVTIFNGPNLDTNQWYMSFLAGVYTQADITSLSSGIGFNMVSSVRVEGPRCSATLYEGPNFNQGPDDWSAELPEGDYDESLLVARGGQSDQMNSLAVTHSTCTATLYDDADLKLEDGLGSPLWHLSLQVGDYPLVNQSNYSLTSLTTFSTPTDPSDLTSSLRVSGPNCFAKTYKSPVLDDSSTWSAVFTEGDYPTAQYIAGGALDDELKSIAITYLFNPYIFPTDLFSGSAGSSSIMTFFPASIGEQWTYDPSSDSPGLTLAAGNSTHHKAVLRSVMFVLPQEMRITVSTSGGGTGSPYTTSVAVQGAVVEYTGNSGSYGFLGVALHDVETNMWLLSKRRTASGSNSEDVIFDNNDLRPYMHKQVTIDIVDSYEGDYGYLSVSSALIEVACDPITTPDSCQYDVTGCAAVMPGRACLIECKGPYTGTAASFSCPAGNTDATTPLVPTSVSLPNCVLPCPNPSPLPAGYISLGGDTVNCSSSYEGVAVKICTVDSATCTRQVTLTGCSLPGMANVAGDPITYYGSVRKEFKVPAGGQLTPLLKVPDMHVFATAVKGHAADEQWLDRIVVRTPAGQEVVTVAIKNDLVNFNRSALPANAFETLTVRMDWWFSRPLMIMPPANEYYIHWHGLRVAFARARGMPLNAPRREMVLVVSQFANVYIASSSAREFYDQPELAYKYAHLDLIVGDMRNRSSFRGLLPELWGIAPPELGQCSGADGSGNRLYL